MSTPIDPQGELPSTYFVHDHKNKEELKRVQIQGQMITAGMGGVLFEQPNPERLQHVLDVGCGTGEWIIEAAKTYPGMSLLIGVDINNKMLDYARNQAKVQQINDRVNFHQMDALQALEFPTDSFDLVNQRMATSYLRTWDWPKVLQEYVRVTGPEGVIRITEPSNRIESSSPTLTHLWGIFQKAFYQAGHLFSPPEKRRIVAERLALLLSQHGVQQVETHIYPLTYRADTPEGQFFIDDMQYFFRTIVPFLKRWTRLPDDYKEIYRQMLRETQQDDFAATWAMHTAWGRKANPA